MNTLPEPTSMGRGRPGPRKVIPFGYRKVCVACGRRIRWALASCFVCNHQIISGHYPRVWMEFN